MEKNINLTDEELDKVAGGTGAQQYVLYTVVKGDTLGEIAGRCRTTVQFLMQINPEITDKNKIKIGQKILIPKI